MNSSKPNISSILSIWYSQNKRNLPWREVNDPYLIWISEIILQQTRVVQGISYYLKFIERFSTVAQLAEAEEDEVLKYWQGLGYYSRARNIHKAARQITNEFGGIFPKIHSDVLKLAGVGEYTAAAICSFAYNQPFAVVDGNVFRVLSRLFGIETAIDSGNGKKEFTYLAQELLSKFEPGLHNQAIMEFGALHCVPVSPDCNNCPFKFLCKANELKLVSFLPIKSKKTKVTQRFFNYIFIEYQGNTYIQQRKAKDIWQNLYEFPLIESNRLFETSELLEDEEFNRFFGGIEKVEIIEKSNSVKHILTHRVIFAQFITITISRESEKLKELIKVPINGLEKYAVSRLMELFLEKLGDFKLK
ncbi:MAG: A/G-specific adenine glycosylase [Paludibacter sp.]